MAGQLHRADLRPLLRDDLMLDIEAFQQRYESRHVISTIRVVGVDARDALELAFPVLDREQRGHDGLALVVGAAEEVARIWQLFIHAILGRAVPVDREGLRLLGHRPEREAYSSRHDTLHAVDVFLLQKLLVTLDRVLGTGLLLDHEFDLAAGDTARSIELLDGPFGG